MDELKDETTYARVRTGQWLTRRRLLRASAVGLGVAAATPALMAGRDRAVEAGDAIVKPLPPELFVDHGTNAEMRFEAMRGQGYFTPFDRFFVRNHTRTPIIDVDTWRLRLFGSGLRGGPTLDRAVEFTYDDLRRMPATSINAYMECTGNGRSLFTSQQGEEVPGTPWRMGAIGMANWRGVRLETVLRRAGLTSAAVDVMPRGLDPNYFDNGVDKGRPRRPLPIEKALDDVLLAYEMNGDRLAPDHGFPIRVVVPSWIGMASIKWVGDIEVSREPLFSPWNTEYYRLFGPSYPPEGGPPLTRQVVRSAFELPFDARIPVFRPRTVQGRSWSGNGRIRRVEVSADGGASWRPAALHGPQQVDGWTRWSYTWRPDRPGRRELMARAVDETGATQPERTPFNKFGYMFDAVVRHPVMVG